MSVRAVRLFVFGSFLASAGLATDRPSDAEIRAVVAENLRASQSVDVSAILETIHPESLAQSTVPQLADALKAYKLKYEAPSIVFVSMAGEYALVRVLQRTTRVEGPDFLDNEIDGIWALRRDGAKWKYWTQMNLKLRPLAQPVPAPQ